MLGETTHSIDPERRVGLIGGLPAEVLDDHRRQVQTGVLAAQAGVLVELRPDDRSLGHELRASRLDGYRLVDPLGRFALFAGQLGEFDFSLLDGARHPVELVSGTIQLDVMSAPQERSVELVHRAAGFVEPCLMPLDRLPGLSDSRSRESVATRRRAVSRSTRVPVSRRSSSV